MESPISLILTKQRNSVDGQTNYAAVAKAVLQHLTNGRAPTGIHSAGQCHMKAKFLEDVGISPLVKIVPLSREQLRWIAPGTIRFRQRCAKRIEFAHAIRGEAFEIRASHGGHDRNEA